MARSPHLDWTPEQRYLAFYLFGRDTGSPCPACHARWATTVRSSGAVVQTIEHDKNCAYMAVFKSQKRAKKKKR